MNIAVIGSGIAGLTTAWELNRQGHQVTIFEMRDRPALLGHTAEFTLGGRDYAIDSLLIWHRYHHHLIQLLDELGLSLATRFFPSVSFFYEDDPKPYAGYRSVRLPLLQRNLLLPWGRTTRGTLGICAFWMRQWLRVKREGRHLDPKTTFASYFRADTDPDCRKLIFPWVNCAIGFPTNDILERSPAMSILLFELATAAHLPHMVAEGMTELARRLAAGCELRLEHEVRRLEPGDTGVRVAGLTAGGEPFAGDFDHAVLAIPPKRIPGLVDVSEAEERIWSSFEDRITDIYVHTDERVLPRDREDWAAINYRMRNDANAQVEFTVRTCLIDRFDPSTEFFHSWNPITLPAEDQILYHNQLIRVLPTVDSQDYLEHDVPQLQGRRNLWYTGTWVVPHRGSYLEEGVQASRRLARRIHAAGDGMIEAAA